MKTEKLDSLKDNIRFRLLNRSIILKYFVAFLVLEFLCFIVLGISFSLLGRGDWTQQKLGLLEENSKSVADFTKQLLENDLANDQKALVMLCNNIKMISEAIDADIYVCNMNGEVILCQHLTGETFEISNGGKCAIHCNYSIPKSVIKEAARGGYSDERTNLDGVYVKEQLVAAEPVVVDGDTVAIVFAATPISLSTTDYLYRTIKIFVIASAVSLLVGAIGIYFFIIFLLSPLRDMSRATKAYASGDFSYRVKVRGGGELESLLQAFNNMAKELSIHESSRRSFVANVSHELKTPMTTIGGFIDGILDGTIPPEKQNYYLKIVSDETKRLSRLVVSMLNLSKIEAGELELKPKSFNICTDIFNVLISFERQIEEKNIEICGLDKLNPTMVVADQDMIHQVIYNLVDNAVKFTQDGELTVEVLVNPDKSTTVKIKNTGAGISQEDLARVFERFYKVDKSRSFDTKSTGLGLYIVKTIVEMHGGSVAADSVEGEYTEFMFTLPDAKPEK